MLEWFLTQRIWSYLRIDILEQYRLNRELQSQELQTFSRAQMNQMDWTYEHLPSHPVATEAHRQ